MATEEEFMYNFRSLNNNILNATLHRKISINKPTFFLEGHKPLFCCNSWWEKEGTATWDFHSHVNDSTHPQQGDSIPVQPVYEATYLEDTQGFSRHAPLRGPVLGALLGKKGLL